MEEKAVAVLLLLAGSGKDCSDLEVALLSDCKPVSLWYRRTKMSYNAELKRSASWLER